MACLLSKREEKIEKAEKAALPLFLFFAYLLIEFVLPELFVDFFEIPCLDNVNKDKHGYRKDSGSD